MTVRHLRIFIAVCRTQNITQAAETLHMTQPAVSVAIREMERFYGVALFDRVARGIRITDAGEKLRAYARDIVSLFDDMEREMKDPDAAARLDVGGSISIGACLMPAFSAEYARRRPNVVLRVKIGNSREIGGLVRSGDLDVGLIEGVPEDDALLSERFMRDELIAVCAAAHPFAGRASVPFEVFAAEPLLLRERGSGTRELFESAAVLRAVALSPLWESVSTTALLSAVAAGRGVSVLPRRLSQSALDSGKIAVVTIENLALDRSYYMIRHRQKRASRNLDAFMTIVRAAGAAEDGTDAAR